ncbi:MAG: DUF86 domain-containing protein [Eggerthellaceae bacterium]|nr:DUF86 domain-containing protein [Eggerthellaceae bacterium]
MRELSVRDQTILEAIVEHCQSIANRLERFDIDKDVFTADAALREMLLFPLLQIGELANRLSEGFTQTHDEIPWRSVVGLRNVVVHKYNALDSDWVWDTITNDLPPLNNCCELALNANEGDDK